jgi:hypothetical protein
MDEAKAKGLERHQHEERLEAGGLVQASLQRAV